MSRMGPDGLLGLYESLKSRFVRVGSTVNNLTTTQAGTVLDGRQGKVLKEACDEKAVTSFYSATLSAAGWSASVPYTQTVSVEGILETDTPIVDVDLSNATSSNYGDMIEAWNAVGRIATGAGTLTAYAYEDKPTQELALQIRVVK